MLLSSGGMRRPSQSLNMRAFLQICWLLICCAALAVYVFAFAFCGARLASQAVTRISDIQAGKP